MSLQDKIIKEFDIALKTLSNKKSGTEREYPTTDKSPELSDDEKKLSSQLMRVNLAGEVAAQALYRGQAFVCKDKNVRDHLVHAGDEETDHLIWCKKRLDELGGKQSILNPVWYAGSFAIGAFFGSLGEGKSLGFVEETEKQVVKHLEKHLDRVSENDVDTIAILKTMRQDEDDHANEASENGSEELSGTTKKIMGYVAKLMTSTSAHI